MPLIEKSGLMRYKDDAGNTYLMLPITTAENVDGLDELIDEAKIISTAVAATSTDGVAYEATVPGITELTAGQAFVMIPNKISTTRVATLNVNGLGAKNLRVRVSGYSASTASPLTTNWLAANKPVRVTYDGMWWITDIVLPSAQQLYGNIPAEDVTYANTSSGLTATQVQAAIDELAGGALRTQVLTTEEYNAVTDKDENVLYILSDDTTEADIEAHIADTEKHVTEADKETWNGKQSKIMASGLLKGDGAGGVSEAVPGTDYLAKAPVTSVNGKTGDVTIGEVPSVTTLDNGKFLRVVNGAWAAAEVDNASGVSF